jgi:hypothetical protein
MRWQNGPDCRQNTRPDQGRQIMHDIFLTPQIAQLQHHPPHDAAARENGGAKLGHGSGGIVLLRAV